MIIHLTYYMITSFTCIWMYLLYIHPLYIIQHACTYMLNTTYTVHYTCKAFCQSDFNYILQESYALNPGDEVWKI